MTPRPAAPFRGMGHFDYVIVGAGFAGSVLAERLASQQNKRVLVLDKRDHIAGNAFDFYNSDGILVHKYGPHIFHTNSRQIVSYLSQFTGWRLYEHRVLSSVDGQLLPIPINLTTINSLYNLQMTSSEMKHFLDCHVVKQPYIRTSKDLILSRVGYDLYHKFFLNYTVKQWALDPSELDASVAGRIPVRYTTDDRYFSDYFQGLPSEGYTRMFHRILSHPNITIQTSIDFKNVKHHYPRATIIYTGRIDEYFDFCFGPLPYRSLEFYHETHDCQIFQSAPVINYPNEYEYTRITEFKYLTGQFHNKTSIAYEYPRSSGEPYYPIPRPENVAIFAKYRELARSHNEVRFCGRLANYRYLNMDQVIGQALILFRELSKE